MGLKRFIWRHTPEGALIDTIRSAVKEKSLIGGLKRMENEKWKEDNPATSAIYKSGKYDGKKEGYVEASAVYEKSFWSRRILSCGRKKSLKAKGTAMRIF